MRVLIMVSIFAGMLLSGCIGGEEVDPAEGAETGGPQGSIFGRVHSEETFEPLEGIRMRLLDQEDVIKETHTADDGNYTLQGIPGGTYRLQAFHLRYDPELVQITLEENATLVKNFSLGRTVARDQTPYNDGPYDFNGHLCGSVTVSPFDPLMPCRGLDENHARWTTVHPGRGLRTLVIGLDWDTGGGGALSANSYTLLVENIVGSRYEVARQQGDEPFEIRIDDDDIDEEKRKFSFYDDPEGPRQALDFSVIPPDGVTYQQAFRIYYHWYYWEEAPSSASVLPEG